MLFRSIPEITPRYESLAILVVSRATLSSFSLLALCLATACLTLEVTCPPLYKGRLSCTPTPSLMFSLSAGVNSLPLSDLKLSVSMSLLEAWIPIVGKCPDR